MYSCSRHYMTNSLHGASEIGVYLQNFILVPVSLLFCVQGTLNKYERRLIEFTFAPRTRSNGKGWNHNPPVPSSRDYSVLMKFVVTNKSPDCDHEGKILELR